VNKKNVTLIEPTTELKTEFLGMAEEYRAAESDRYKSALENFPVYLEQVLSYARGVELNTDRVPESEFWLVADGKT
jgi:predicted acetyltransferase